MQIRYTVTSDTNFFYVTEITTQRKARFFSRETAMSVCAMLNCGSLLLPERRSEQREDRANGPGATRCSKTTDWLDAP